MSNMNVNMIASWNVPAGPQGFVGWLEIEPPPIVEWELSAPVDLEIPCVLALD